MPPGAIAPPNANPRSVPLRRILNPQTGGLLIALLLVGFVAVASFLSWQQYVRFAEFTRRSNEAIARLNTTVLSVREAESSQRGFLLTHDDRYLSQYRTSVAAVGSNTAALEGLPWDPRYRGLLSRLKTALEGKLTELDATIALVERGNWKAAVDLVKSNRGLRSMTEINGICANFQAQLRGVLRQNRENSRFYARLSQYVATLGCAGIFVLVYLSNRKVTRLLSSAAVLNTELASVNSDLRQFVYSASHDLREPLRTVAVYAEFATKKAREQRPFETDLRFVNEAARLMTQIVDDLLVYTQAVIECVPQAEAADMNQVVRAVCEGMRASIEESKAQIDLHVLGAMPISSAHAHILVQNLLSNALKYRSATEAPRIEIGTGRDGHDASLFVSDNGLGIEPEYQEYIFGLFKRLHSRDRYPGTGLGLAICKKIIDRYGGTISVKSEPGKGSTFTVRVPAAPST